MSKLSEWLILCVTISGLVRWAGPDRCHGGQAEGWGHGPSAWIPLPQDAQDCGRQRWESQTKGHLSLSCCYSWPLLKLLWFHLSTIPLTISQTTVSQPTPRWWWWLPVLDSRRARAVLTWCSATSTFSSLSSQTLSSTAPTASWWWYLTQVGDTRVTKEKTIAVSHTAHFLYYND